MVSKRLALYLPVSLLICGIHAAAQGNQQQQTPPPEKPPEAPKTLPNSVTGDTAGAAVDLNTYIIGSEDVLYISVFNEPQLTGAVSVRPDGKITKPLVGDVQAAGLTPERLRQQLKQAFSTYINTPDVTITVAQVNSKRFNIAGEVLRPGAFPLVLPTKVFDALSAAGFRDFANKGKIVIIRGPKRIKFNYTQVLKGKNLEQNIFLEPGDTIYVP